MYYKTETQFLQNIKKTQNKALTIMTFQNSWQPSEQIYKESKIIKLRDSAAISNLELAYEQMKKIYRGLLEVSLLIKPVKIFVI